jgi:hypothetical protein
MLEFEVITLQEVSKPVQSRDMSKINFPCDWKIMESNTWRCSWSPCSTRIQALSGKDNVSRNSWMLCIMICYAWWFYELGFLICVFYPLSRV